MGTCKDQMKDKEGKSVFGFMKRKDKTSTESKAQTFADMIVAAEEKLTSLISVKESELKSEKNREEYNRKALALLKTMEFHLNEVVDAAANYSEL